MDTIGLGPTGGVVHSRCLKSGTEGKETQIKKNGEGMGLVVTDPVGRDDRREVLMEGSESTSGTDLPGDGLRGKEPRVGGSPCPRSMRR